MGSPTPVETKGTGKWQLRGFPHSGFTCIAHIDLENFRETCEMCEVAEVRYVHVMSHPVVGLLRCGCICAGWIEGNSEAAVQRDRKAINRATRKANWLDRKWRVSKNGNKFLNTDGYNICVFFNRGSGSWAGSIQKRTPGARAYFSKRYYTTPDEAAMGTFDALMFLLEKKQ